MCENAFPLTTSLSSIMPSKRNASMSNNSNKQQWYDAECKILRSNFYSYLNIYRIEKGEPNQCNLLKARSDYKRVTRRKRYDPKEYWKLLKQTAASNNESTITPKNLKTISENLVTRMTLFMLPMMMF